MELIPIVSMSAIMLLLSPFAQVVEESSVKNERWAISFSLCFCGPITTMSPIRLPSAFYRGMCLVEHTAGEIFFLETTVV